MKESGHRSELIAPAIAALLATAGGALALRGEAADAHQVLINAVLLSKSNCKFNTGGSVISLSIDPAATSPLVATGGVAFRCEGTAVTASYGVSNNSGLYGSGSTNLRMRNSSPPNNTIGYSLTYPASGATPKNVSTTFTVTVSVTPGEFQNAWPGNYTDTVTLTISP